MNTSNRRKLLLSGASVAALGMSALAASPALAAPHDTFGPGTASGTSVTSATVTICTLATNAACFFGVYDTAGGAANAVVNSTLTGQIRQGDAAAFVDLDMINAAGDSAEVGAIAVVTGTPGAAAANAVLSSAIQQFASASTALLSLDNNGSLLIDASAVAVATGAAAANAEIVDYGFAQLAFGGSEAGLEINNSGDLTVLARAQATAVGGAAAANAEIATGALPLPGGIVQAALLADTIEIDLNNATGGNLAIGVSAIANASAAAVNAELPYGIVQFGLLGDTIDIGLANSGTIDINANASVEATAVAAANAVLQNGVFQGALIGLTAAHAHVTNDGLMTFGAMANAVAGTTVDANANIAFGIGQMAIGSAAVASVNNSGTMDIGALAHASADIANASAIVGVDSFATFIEAGIGQLAVGATATAALHNAGLLDIHATASATGGATAFANAMANGVYQLVNGTSALATVTNAGIFSIAAIANASATGSAVANAIIDFGIAQNVSGTATAQANLTNSGTIAALASANASGDTAIANAVIGAIVSQSAVGSVVSLTNSGVISGVANANASGGLVANAVAAAAGVPQTAVGATGTAEFFNSGTVAVSANAAAVAGDDAAVDNANAVADAEGIVQTVTATLASVSLTNSGTMSVVANATATAQEVANAVAAADGVAQNINGAATGAAFFSNAGVFNVAANAAATADTANAVAAAQGYRLQAAGVNTAATVLNSGTMAVSAIALAGDGVAVAAASGIDASGVLGTVSVSNAGILSVLASASGAATSVAVAGGINVPSPGGLVIVTNSGTLSVDAVTANGGTTVAVGIDARTTAGPAPGDLVTVTNDGDIIVRESTDGGATWTRGMAITVSGSTSPSVVNLLSGNIYGDIDVNAGDEINVADGTTYFDGIINPEFMPVGGITPLVLDSGLFGEGDLNIDAGGNLILADPRITGDPDMYDGPAYAFIDTLNMGPDGTITFELQPLTGGDQAPGTYPQVFAAVANLDGTLVADITPAGGIFDNEYFWDNVIDANARNGTFDACVVGAPYANSVLLTTEDICVYDANNNVDLLVERIAFDAVPGLTFNQESAAFGLECLYDEMGAAALIGTPIGGVIADLFLADAVTYPGALDQLAAAGYAGYLQSFGSLGYHYNAILDRATDCEVPALAGSALECRTAPMHLWGQIDYQWRKKDGDVEASRYHADRWSALLGFDVNVGPTAVVGISLGKVWNDVDFRNVTNASVKGDGWQLGLYGTYDPGAFYIKAMTSYSKFDGDARRLIDFRPFGGLTNGTINGDPDVRLWTFGLHGGYRIPMGPTSVITPFLNYDYTSAKLKSFAEGGGTGAELDVNGGSHKNSWLTAGVKWAGQIGGLVPEVEVGYRHMFGDRRASFNANFAGFDDCDFDIISASEKRGAITAGLSVGGKLGIVDLRIGYEGAYNSDITEHSGFLKLVLPLGAVAAPPPPPVVAPPPPPPPPATQTCPDGTVILATETCPAPPPPPPPPPPAPERG